MAYASIRTDVPSTDIFGFDGLNRKRVKLAESSLDVDHAAIVTQDEQMTAKTYFNVADTGTILRHIEHGDPEQIEATKRHELELYGLAISRLPDFANLDEETSFVSRLVFYDVTSPANGTQPELFSIGVDSTGIDKTIRLPGPVRFTNGISVRCISLNGQPGPKIEILTLFYREVSFDTHYETLAPTVVDGESIQGAIDAAQTGETVLVGAGVYVGDLNIATVGVKLVTLQQASIIGNITVSADNVVVDGFTMISPQPRKEIALRLQSGDGAVIRNMNLQQFDFAVVHTDATSVTYSRNTFTDNLCGIGSTQNVTGLQIHNNRFELNGDGIRLNTGSTLAHQSIADVLAQNLFLDNTNKLVDFRDDPPVAYGGPQPSVVAGDSIQAAVDAAQPGDTIFIGPGVYEEIVTIEKEITLLSTLGSDHTFIKRPDTSNSLGTVLILPNTSNVTLGGPNLGFTIVGGDSASPGIEFAAVYIQGNGHSNHEISNNVIIADGDAGLMSEFNTSIDGLIIESNTFGGKTFVGDEPATGDQFTVENVARQMVVISGGADVTNTKNVSFINNTVGGASGANSIGNVGVTIDVVGGTVSGNFFNIDTGGNPALRVRGPDTIVENNTFEGNNTGLFEPTPPTTTVDPDETTTGGDTLTVT